MNNKAQTLGLGIISMIMILIVGFMMINFLHPEITNFRTNIGCADATSISDGTKLICLITDTVTPYWIWLILSVSFGAILMRLTL